MAHKEQATLEGFEEVTQPSTPFQIKTVIKGGSPFKCATRNCKQDPTINYKERWLCEKCWQKNCEE